LDSFGGVGRDHKTHGPVEFDVLARDPSEGLKDWQTGRAEMEYERTNGTQYAGVAEQMIMRVLSRGIKGAIGGRNRTSEAEVSSSVQLRR
jgi:hypothetical protein